MLGNVESGLANELGDHGGVEACGVVLDAESARIAVKTEMPDAINVAYAGQRAGHLLRRWSDEVKENLHRGHRHRITAGLKTA